MAKDRDDELNKDVPGGEEFSLESILAEFGGGPARKKRDRRPFSPFRTQNFHFPLPLRRKIWYSIKKQTPLNKASSKNKKERVI